MTMKAMLAALAAVAGLLLTTAQAHAWGAYHVGYTHVGPAGVQHYGRTAAVGPYGAYSGAHVGGYNAYGDRYGYGSADTLRSYGGGYGAGAYHYSTAGYGGYSTGGFRTGGFTDYSTGLYRRW